MDLPTARAASDRTAIERQIAATTRGDKTFVELRATPGAGLTTWSMSYADRRRRRSESLKEKRDDEP